MNNFILAALLGVSFGNLWICALLVFSLQNTMRYTAAGYLVGRFVAILLLSFSVSLLGYFITISHSSLNIVSGLFLLLFSAYMFALHVFAWIPFWKKKSKNSHSIHSICDGNCSSCPTHTIAEYESACSDCEEHGICSAEEPEIEALTREARATKGKYVGDRGNVGFISGFFLGMLRGVAMCAKLSVLLPVLISATIFKALAIGAIFALTSSIYPLLGFFMGSFALKFLKYKKILFILSSSLLAFYGFFYLYKGIISF